MHAHRALDEARDALSADQGIAAHDLAACAFTAEYLAHMDEEERDVEPAILAALSPDEIANFGRRSVERTASADQRMKLGWMLPAMTRLDAAVLLGRLPPALAAELRPLSEEAS